MWAGVVEVRLNHPRCHRGFPPASQRRPQHPSGTRRRETCLHPTPPPESPRTPPAARRRPAAAVPCRSRGAPPPCPAGPGCTRAVGARGSDRREHRPVTCRARRGAEIRVPTLGRRHQRHWPPRRGTRPPRGAGDPAGEGSPRPAAGRVGEVGPGRHRWVVRAQVGGQVESYGL